MKLCAKCVLPETFPGISYDENGICNHCQTYKGADHEVSQKSRYRAKFEKLWNERKRDGTYDGLMCYSGGKDSSYTMALMAENYDARILAITVDNGFVSPTAVRNIRAVTESVGVDHVFIKPRFDVLARIFTACAEKPIFPPKSLERASTICTSCMAIVKFTTLQIAIEKKIPFMIFGWSPGQAPISSSVFKNNPSMIRKMQESLKEPLEGVVGDEISPYFLREEHFAMSDHFPHNINPLAFFPYDESAILQRIAELGWEKPDDTDPNSTNCLLNAYGNAVHRKQFGYNPYAFELGKLVREGVMERSDAIARLSAPENKEIVLHVKERLGISN